MKYGIDLGTTNSCVAGWNDKMESPRFYINQVTGNTVTPSVVFFDPHDNNRILVGDTALAAFMSNPSRVVRGIKRRIGDAKSYDPTQNGLPNGTDPVAISSLILKKMVQDIKRGYQQDVRDVVITVPAYFGLEQRAKTKLAGEYAGLNVLELIPEPTAAALSYGIDLKEDKNLIVYDLGGGTFDVTFVRIIAKNDGTCAFNYIALDGDEHLGGLDWDRILAQIFLEEYNRQTGRNYQLRKEEDLTDDGVEAKLTATLLHEAERYKKILTQVDRTNWTISFDGCVVNGVVTLEEFNKRTRDLLDRTLLLTENVIKTACNEGFTQPENIILVGGSTRMTQVKTALEEKFGIDTQLHEPDFAVANGAAIYANNLGRYINDTTRIGTSPISNILSKTYGIRIMDGSVSNIIFRNERLPIDKLINNRYFTAHNNQNKISLPIYESNLLESRDNLSISPDEVNNTCKKVADCIIGLNKEYPQDTPIQMHIKANNEQLIDIEVDILGEKQSTQIKFSINENQQMRQYIDGATVE